MLRSNDCSFEGQALGFHHSQVWLECACWRCHWQVKLSSSKTSERAGWNKANSPFVYRNIRFARLHNSRKFQCLINELISSCLQYVKPVMNAFVKMTTRFSQSVRFSSFCWTIFLQWTLLRKTHLLLVSPCVNVVFNSAVIKWLTIVFFQFFIQWKMFSTLFKAAILLVPRDCC